MAAGLHGFSTRSERLEGDAISLVGGHAFNHSKIDSSFLGDLRNATTAFVVSAQNTSLAIGVGMKGVSVPTAANG